MRKLFILSVVLIAVSSISSTASAISEVKFMGHAVSDERIDELICYGHPYCNVTVEQVLYDPNNTLVSVSVIRVCYNESRGTSTGEPLECFGLYYNDVGPFQYLGCVVCIGNSYYVVPELQSFLILPLFMIATLLAVIVYKRMGSHTHVTEN